MQQEEQLSSDHREAAAPIITHQESSTNLDTNRSLAEMKGRVKTFREQKQQIALSEEQDRTNDDLLDHLKQLWWHVHTVVTA